MSLDNIQLNPFLVQHLYKSTLVELETAKTPVPISGNSSISFLGKNEKNILIVVNESEMAFMPDSDLNLLVGILTACKLSLADVAVIKFDKNKSLSYDKMLRDFSPGFILLFGVNPSELSFPLHFPHYQLQQYNNQTYLSAPSLKIIAAEKEQKKQLWSCLQKYFL